MLYCILFVLLFPVGCLLLCHNLRKNTFTDNTKLKPGPSIRVHLHGYRSALPRASPMSASSLGVPRTLQHLEVGIRMTSCLCRLVSDQGCPPYPRVLCQVIDLPCHLLAVTSASVWPLSRPLITAPLNPCHLWDHKAPHRFQRWRKGRWIVEFRVCFTERVCESLKKDNSNKHHILVHYLSQSLGQKKGLSESMSLLTVIVRKVILRKVIRVIN